MDDEFYKKNDHQSKIHFWVLTRKYDAHINQQNLNVDTTLAVADRQD